MSEENVEMVPRCTEAQAIANWTLLVALIAALLVTGCGGGDGDGDEEQDAREAVAAFVKALAADEPQTVCDSLSPEGQRRAVDRMNVAAEESRYVKPVKPGDCAGTMRYFTRLLENPLLAELANGIESGEVRGEAVAVDLAESTGTVTVPDPDAALPFPVEVGGEWLVADPAALLFPGQLGPVTGDGQ